MSDITIQQTLKIVDGRLSPSVDPIDGDLVEVSKAPNNAIEIKEDGLYVPIPTISETPSSGGEVESIIVREIAKNGSYTDKLSPTKSLTLTLPITEGMVDQYSNQLVSPYTIDLTPYSYKTITNVYQVFKEDTSSVDIPSVHSVLNFTYEKDANDFIKNVKIKEAQGLVSGKVVGLSPITINGNQEGNPSLYEVYEGMRSFSGFGTSGHTLGLEVNGTEVYRFVVGYYYFTELIDYVFQAGDSVVLKSYGVDGTEAIEQASRVIPESNITINNEPLVDQLSLSGTYTPNSTFTLTREHAFESTEITSNSAGQWTYTSEKPFRLNETIKFTVNGTLAKAAYVLDNPEVDLSVVIRVCLDGILGETLTLESKVDNSFILNSIDSVVETPLQLPEEVTHRYKIKQTKKSDETQIVDLNFLNKFKSISDIRLKVNIEQRNPSLGNNLLSVGFNPVTINKANGKYTMEYPGIAYGIIDKMRDPVLSGFEIGSTLIKCDGNLDLRPEVTVDGVSYNINRDYDTRVDSAEVPALVEGQAIKFIYKSYSNDIIYETIDCIVGTDNPVLTLNRPPLVDYSAETEYFELEVKGALV